MGSSLGYDLALIELDIGIIKTISRLQGFCYGCIYLQRLALYNGINILHYGRVPIRGPAIKEAGGGGAGYIPGFL